MIFETIFQLIQLRIVLPFTFKVGLYCTKGKQQRQELVYVYSTFCWLNLDENYESLQIHKYINESFSLIYISNECLFLLETGAGGIFSILLCCIARASTSGQWKAGKYIKWKCNCKDLGFKINCFSLPPSCICQWVAGHWIQVQDQQQLTLSQWHQTLSQYFLLNTSLKLYATF